MGAPYTNVAPWGSEAAPAWAFSSSSSGSEARLRCREPGSLTGQKAEPVGMKLTLFLSGQEKRGTDADVDCLALQRNVQSVCEDHTLSSLHKCNLTKVDALIGWPEMIFSVLNRKTK